MATAAPAPPQGARTLRAPVIDYRRLAQSRDNVLAAVTNTLSPVFALAHHGLEADISALIASVVAQSACDGGVAAHFRRDAASAGSFAGTAATDLPSCVSIEMESVMAPTAAAALHRRLARVVENLLVCLLGLCGGARGLEASGNGVAGTGGGGGGGDNRGGECGDADGMEAGRARLAALLQSSSSLSASSSSSSSSSSSDGGGGNRMVRAVGGRESLRFYPHDGDGVLGAHVDMNMITLLWANGPGLEILDPAAPGVTPGAVRRSGFPMIGTTTADDDAMARLGDDGWVTVDADWADGVFLVSIGDEWFRTFSDAATAAALPSLPQISSPVLHRVNRRLRVYSAPGPTDGGGGAGGGSGSGGAGMRAGGGSDDGGGGGGGEKMSIGRFWKDGGGRFSLPFLARLVDREPQDGDSGGGGSDAGAVETGGEEDDRGDVGRADDVEASTAAASASATL